MAGNRTRVWSGINYLNYTVITNILYFIFDTVAFLLIKGIEFELYFYMKFYFYTKSDNFNIDIKMINILDIIFFYLNIFVKKLKIVKTRGCITFFTFSVHWCND